MERRNGGAAVWLLCFVVVGGAGFSAEHSTQQWQSEPADPGHRGSASAPAPRHRGLSPPAPAPAPAPTAGADDLPAPAPVYSPAPVTTTPHFGFPLQPTVGVTAAPPGEGYPFIGSNPTVPLPTGVTDTASVLPLPDTTQTHDKVVGRASLVLRAAPAAMIGLLLAFSVLLFN